MITLLATRLEASAVDVLDLGGDFFELLLNLPELDEGNLRVAFMHGVVESIDLAERFVAVMLPGASFDVVPMMTSCRMFAAAVDTGRGFPFSGFARTPPRALLAAALRAYDDATSFPSSADLVADNANAPVCLSRVAGVAE